MDQVELIATAAMGVEAVVGRELERLGYGDREVENGRVTFSGDLSAICRANLWLRSADRVLMKVGEFAARDFGELFDRTRELPWEAWIPRDGAFPVRGRSVKSQLRSVPDCQSLVKKAIVEKLKETHATEWFEETGPTFQVEVALRNDVATLTLDTSGEGLFKRGYRTEAGPAPLKETLAAALVQLSFWNRERLLIDPLCGTGTIPIEAALLGRNVAPGRNRTFAAESWPVIPSRLWDEAREEARDLVLGPFNDPLRGSDLDPAAIERARACALQAGVAEDVSFEVLPVSKLRSHRRYGCVICNPPYGERLGEGGDVAALYAEMGRAFRKLETWSWYVLTAHPEFEECFGRDADRRRKLYNGRIPCTFYQFHGPRPPWERR